MIRRSKARLSAAAATVFSFAALMGTATLARADDSDPGVARVALVSGDVDVQRGDANQTFAAAVNAPIDAGDYVTTQDSGRAELQFGYRTSLRVAPDTQVRFATLDDATDAVQLAQGSVVLRLFHGTGAHAEIDAPNATIRPRSSGRFRVSVDESGNTEVTVRSGRADVFTAGDRRQTLAPGSTLEIDGNDDDLQLQSIAEIGGDDFDSWSDGLDRSEADVPSYAYVDDRIVGSEDLDRYGSWSDVPGYGEAWRPSYASDFSPYGDGRWTWEPYYGWTWVDAEPWGYAPYHYGRWFYADRSWYWTPALAYAPPVYSPALVAFFSFGGGDFDGGPSGFGNIGWVPLAPREAYVPTWGDGYGYGGDRYGNDDRTTIVNHHTDVTNVTDIDVTKIYEYRNANAPGGVIAIRRNAFGAGRITREQRLAIAQQALRAANVSAIRGVVPVVPTERSLAYTSRPAAATQTRLSPHFSGFARPRTATTASFAAQRSAIATAAAREFPEQRPVFLEAARTGVTDPQGRMPDPAPANPLAARAARMKSGVGEQAAPAPAGAATVDGASSASVERPATPVERPAAPIERPVTPVERPVAPDEGAPPPEATHVRPAAHPIERPAYDRDGTVPRRFSRPNATPRDDTGEPRVPRIAAPRPISAPPRPAARQAPQSHPSARPEGVPDQRP